MCNQSSDEQRYDEAHLLDVPEIELMYPRDDRVDQIVRVLDSLALLLVLGSLPVDLVATSHEYVRVEVGEAVLAVRA